MSYDYELDGAAELGEVRSNLKSTWDNNTLQGRKDWLSNINLEESLCECTWDSLDASVRHTVEVEYLAEMYDKHSGGW